MKTLTSGTAISAAILLATITTLPAETPPGPDPGLCLERAENILIVRWDASTGGTQLVWAPTLSDDDSIWEQIPNPTLTPDGEWESMFTLTPPKAFFQLLPADAPVVPHNLLVTVRDGNLVVEWDSTSDAAGYVVYIGDNASVGPADHLASHTLNLGNCFEVTGLTDGVTYFITLVATNLAGVSDVAPAVSAVFGPQGKVTAHVVQRFTLGSGVTFDVEAGGASISLVDDANAAAPPINEIADSRGFVEFLGIPDGQYSLFYSHLGIAGQHPGSLMVSDGGLDVSPVLIAPPSPPQPAETILGTLTLSNNLPARANLPEFGVMEEAVLVAELSGAPPMPITPDHRGRFALTNVPAAYPVTLRATYQGYEVTHVIAAPPAVLEVISLQFAVQVPQVGRFLAMQNGAEVSEIETGIPVTFSASIDNPDAVALKHFWVAEFNDERQTATGAQPTFTFVQPPGPGGTAVGDARHSGMARIRYRPDCLSDGIPDVFEVPVLNLRPVGPCWSGMVGSWHSGSPDDIASAHPATVTLTRSAGPSLNAATSLANGYFELATFPTGSDAPFVLRADKPGHMRFLWPFEHRLPLESQFCVVPADVYDGDHLNTSGDIVIDHPSGAKLSLPINSVKTNLGSNYLGTVVIEMATFDALARHPLLPNAELRDGSTRRGIRPVAGVWFSLRTPLGDPLKTTSSATLVLPVSPIVLNAQLPAYHQDESTAYFERWGVGGNMATRIASERYEIPLGTEGLFLVGHDEQLLDVEYAISRSLAPPFDVLVNTSIFPITIYGQKQNSIDHLYLPANIPTTTRVLELRQAPGLHFPDPATSTVPLSPMKKTVITQRTNPMTPGPPNPPAITTHRFFLTLVDSAPGILNANLGNWVYHLQQPEHFLSRGGVSTPAETAEYYAKIRAPATLSAWRALNGFPPAFAGPLPSAPPNDYATVYYYNLGDLGFARAQTMRITDPGADGQPDVAFAVTNYRTLEDARCGRGAIATVCMDYAARADLGKTKKTRYTRFYVYGSNDKLLDGADLDGGGLKYVPNLCVTCHGGSVYKSGNSPDLGSAFLPFDLEAYTFHPKFGVQAEEMAKMNAAVLKTNPTAAIRELIEGWYSAPDPNTNPLAFDHAHVPTSWSTDPGFYDGVFKGSCRVCHISREANSFTQFDSYSAADLLDFGHYPACNRLDMPHAHRTWGVFWGSRGAANLGAPVPDAPTILGITAEKLCR